MPLLREMDRRGGASPVLQQTGQHGLRVVRLAQVNRFGLRADDPQVASCVDAGASDPMGLQGVDGAVHRKAFGNAAQIQMAGACAAHLAVLHCQLRDRRGGGAVHTVGQQPPEGQLRRNPWVKQSI